MITKHSFISIICSAVIVFLLASCNPSQKLKDGEFLLERNYIIDNTSVLYRDEKCLDDDIGFYVDVRINNYKDWNPTIILVKHELQQIFSITEDETIEFLKNRMQEIVEGYFND